MTTITGPEIEKIINLFNKRGVKFYHACQYKDFKTYIELCGVPSRNLMEQSGLPYTPFDTDETDKTSAVWNKVFGNLQDFGFSFAGGQRNPRTAPTPNPFGPVLFIFNPEVFREAKDIAICLRSAGGRNFNRENEALPTATEVNRIFLYEEIEDAPNGYARANIKFTAGLREEFNDPGAKTPEVSCIVENERFSFNHLCNIMIDPYVINNQNLFQKVRKIKNENGLHGRIEARTYSEGQFRIIQELANFILQDIISIPQIIENKNCSENLWNWATKIQTGNIIYQFDRFAGYLRIGTILELNEGVIPALLHPGATSTYVENDLHRVPPRFLRTRTLSD